MHLTLQEKPLLNLMCFNQLGYEKHCDETKFEVWIERRA